MRNELSTLTYFKFKVLQIVDADFPNLKWIKCIVLNELALTQYSSQYIILQY